ncbi:MAG: hypothetical protein V5789_12725 [Colwellia sp.]
MNYNSTSAKKINKTWLLKAIQKIAKDTFNKTGHSLNGLPEYYVNVKLADELIKANKKFKLEYPALSLAEELGIDLPTKDAQTSKYRLEKGAIDLVVQSAKEYKSQHLIEIKRSSKQDKLRADLERLTWFVSKDIKRTINKAYVILISPLSQDDFKERTRLEEYYLRKEFNNELITLTFKACELSNFNTRQASINHNANNADKSVNALIWEVKLKRS